MTNVGRADNNAVTFEIAILGPRVQTSKKGFGVEIVDHWIDTVQVNHIGATFKRTDRCILCFMERWRLCFSLACDT